MDSPHQQPEPHQKAQLPGSEEGSKPEDIDPPFEPLQAMPLYQRVRNLMVQNIINGTWRAGERLPNEFDLARHFGVSQGTVRKAMDDLETQGLLHRRQGHGTTVAQLNQQEALYSFFRLRTSDGRLATPIPLFERVYQRPASDEECTSLSITKGNTVVVERVRAHNGTPFTLERMMLNPERVPGLTNEESLPNSLYPYLFRKFGIAIVNADEYLTATVADPEQAQSLNIRQGHALLSVQRIAHDLAGNIVELRRSVYRTDSTRYHVELQRKSPMPLFTRRYRQSPTERR